ncbi:MAG: hypothetical protein RL711_1111, partial [Bacteroidota bacterium]
PSMLPCSSLDGSPPLTGHQRPTDTCKTSPSKWKNAMADALKKTGADILIEPVFVIETYNANVIVTVSGFPAKYIHFKSFTLADTMLINHHSLKYRLLLN